MKTTALIMAGGKGERFWPKSRLSLPKQFLSLTDDGKTMIQLTVERISPIVDIKDVYIATNKNYKELVKQQLPGIPEENILCEPIGRNTAPCIGLGAVHAAKKYEDAVMVVLPSDHLIKNNEVFVDTLKNACEIAESDNNLVTIGITPNYPETGYGYIKYDKSLAYKAGYEVQKFVEKPDLETAKSYLADGTYLWNSGMFAWKVSTILGCFDKFMHLLMKDFLRLRIQLERQKNRLFLKENSQSLNHSQLTMVLWKMQIVSISFQEILAGMMLDHGLQLEESRRMMRTTMLLMEMLWQLIQKTA